MNNESHGNKVEELVNELVKIAGITAATGTTTYRQFALEKAIEAIRVLTIIAEKGGYVEDHSEHGWNKIWDGLWCAEQAKQYLESLK